MFVLVVLCFFYAPVSLQQRGFTYPIPDRPVIYPGTCRTVDGQRGHCEAISSCFARLGSVEQFSTSICYQDSGQLGFCCPFTSPIRLTEADSPVVPTSDVDSFPSNVHMPDITLNDINDSGRTSITHMRKVSQIENELTYRDLYVKKNTAEAFHQAFFGHKAIAQTLGKLGNIGLQMSKELYFKFQLTPIQGRDGLVKFNMKNSNFESICTRPPTCYRTKYRTIDGSCNNFRNPEWGKSFTPFQRFMLPRYVDGVNLPRIATDGGPLPSARLVSSMANPDANVPHSAFTLVTMQWAQFLDHDLTVATITKGPNGEGIKCCDPEIQNNPSLRHPACFEIDIPKDDYFYSNYGQTCMEFIRSSPAPRPGCTLGPREQMNQLTAFIDGSMIYGSIAEDEHHLRAYDRGRMKSLRYNNVDLLPREINKTQECVQRQSELFCFMAGDERVNEQISLTSMHTIWMREHNRIAQELLNLNPNWSDESLYQESRRIVSAQIQHITFNEFLPLLLGRRVMRSFGILLEINDYSTSYDSSLNPSIANGFATAAYRYGHTLVQGNINMLNSDYSVAGRVSLSSQFFNPLLMYGPGNLDKFLRGLTGQPAQKFDRFVTDQITNHLFEIPGKGFGMDLIALNIQRGRDHGIPPYNDWRSHCGFKRLESFDQLDTVMNSQSAQAFRLIYRSVDDIDLFPAGVAEYSLPNATLGPTFACIVAEQFRRLKRGDRFWYENGSQDGSFSKDQLAQIRKTSLSRIFCDNSDDIRRLQPLAFIRPNQWNPIVNCESSRQIPRLDFRSWRNEPLWQN